MNKTILVLLVVFQLLFTSSFASVIPKALTESNGKAAYTLDCRGTGKDWSDCFKEAEKLCPDGFSYTKKSLGVVSTQINGRSYIAPSKELVIECK
jgi:hypothetical protein